MFRLADFYDYAEENDVDVIPYIGMPHPAATLRAGDHYAVAIDFSKIDTTRQLRSMCMHEQGHCMTGALHKVDSPFELVERMEHRAHRAVIERYLTPADFQKAFNAGYTELWELEEWFDLPQEDILRAYHYWTECKGIHLNT